MCGCVCEERLGRKEEERESQCNCVGSKIMDYMAEELIRDLVKPNKIIDEKGSISGDVSTCGRVQNPTPVHRREFFSLTIVMLRISISLSHGVRMSSMTIKLRRA
jgi:hypothetical protein